MIPPNNGCAQDPAFVLCREGVLFWMLYYTTYFSSPLLGRFVLFLRSIGYFTVPSHPQYQFLNSKQRRHELVVVELFERDSNQTRLVQVGCLHSAHLESFFLPQNRLVVLDSTPSPANPHSGLRYANGICHHGNNTDQAWHHFKSYSW